VKKRRRKHQEKDPSRFSIKHNIHTYYHPSVNQSPLWNFKKKRRNISDIYINNNQKLIIYNKKQEAKSKKPSIKFSVSTKQSLPPFLLLSPKKAQ